MRYTQQTNIFIWKIRVIFSDIVSQRTDELPGFFPYLSLTQNPGPGRFPRIFHGFCNAFPRDLFPHVFGKVPHCRVVVLKNVGCSSLSQWEERHAAALLGSCRLVSCFGCRDAQSDSAAMADVVLGGTQLTMRIHG